MKDYLKQIVYVITKNNGSITKDEIKDKVYDFAKSKNLLTREFVNAFGDIGWLMQDLRLDDELVKSERVGRYWYWSVR